MKHSTLGALSIGTLLAICAPWAAAQQPANVVDWGGGYVKGGDSASVTPATSGAVQRKVPEKPKAPQAAPKATQEKLTDWGGGYFKGGDSASITPATSGAGTKAPVR